MAASLISASASSVTCRKHGSFSISVIHVPHSSNLQLGTCQFGTWNGLKHQGVPTSRYIVKIERRGRCRGKGVYASLFGVGAPEVLVIGVVALLVFGPKGLAEVARNIGQTFRAFQPTIRELQDVSREFRDTLQREIGLDDSQDMTTTKDTLDSASNVVAGESETVTEPTADGSPPSSKSYTTEDYLEIFSKQLKEQKAKEQAESASSRSLYEPEDGSPSSSDPLAAGKHTEDQFEASTAQQQKEIVSAGSSVEHPENTGSVTRPSENAEIEKQMKIAEDQLEASGTQQEQEMVSTKSQVESHSQPEGSSKYSTKVDSIQEYLKKLEQEWESLNSEKQKQIAPGVTEVKSQVSDTQKTASFEPSFQNAETRDQITTTKEQSGASAAQQETASSETQIELEGQPRDSSPYSIKADSVQEYLQKLEQEWETLNSEKQTNLASGATEVNPQASDAQEATSEGPLLQRHDNLDRMQEGNRSEDTGNSVHQLQ